MIGCVMEILFTLFVRPLGFENLIFFNCWINIIRIKILLITTFELIFYKFKMSKSLQWTDRLMSKFLSMKWKSFRSCSLFSFMTICHKFIDYWLIIFSVLIHKLRKLLGFCSLIVLLLVQSVTFNLIFIRRKITVVASILLFYLFIFLIKFENFWIWIFYPTINSVGI